jgi:hypothetical protein
MTMCDSATLNNYDVGRQPEFPHDRKHSDSESLIDFNALDVAVAPAGARKSLFDSGDQAEAKQVWLDRSDAVRREPSERRQTTSIGPSFACQHFLSFDHLTYS